MGNRTSAHDRRGPHRPVHGDRRICASCGNSARFEERYAVARRGITLRDPAWVCRGCGAEAFVRQDRARTRTLIEARRVIAARSPVGGGKDRAELWRVLRTITGDAQRPGGAARGRAPALAVLFAQVQFVSVIASDDDARVVEANAAACALTGLPRRVLLKFRVGDLFCERPERFDRTWRRFVESGEFAGTCRLRQGSGLLVSVECVASAHAVPGVHVGALASRRLLQSLA